MVGHAIEAWAAFGLAPEVRSHSAKNYWRIASCYDSVMRYHAIGFVLVTTATSSGCFWHERRRDPDIYVERPREHDHERERGRDHEDRREEHHEDHHHE